ncbi:hypothetical protein V5O48_016746 [Marasmius crinis-equi]|uniref:Uncharacterized protein n=1 Tax=Marasmius crinis-equi TaxID=585013 RepID=A0ABR3ER14_9AGAR
MDAIVKMVESRHRSQSPLCDFSFLYCAPKSEAGLHDRVKGGWCLAIPRRPWESPEPAHYRLQCEDVANSTSEPGTVAGIERLKSLERNSGIRSMIAHATDENLMWATPPLHRQFQYVW